MSRVPKSKLYHLHMSSKPIGLSVDGVVASSPSSLPPLKHAGRSQSRTPLGRSPSHAMIGSGSMPRAYSNASLLRSMSAAGLGGWWLARK